MSQYNSLRATIDANIKTNGNEEITGAVLNSVLNAMVTTLGAGFQFMGTATPTNPGSAQTPDYKCFYIATTPGTYTYLGGLVVNAGEVAFLKYDTSWVKDVPGIASAQALNAVSQKVDQRDSSIFNLEKSTFDTSLFWMIEDILIINGDPQEDYSLFQVSPTRASIKKGGVIIADNTTIADTGNNWHFLKGQNGATEIIYIKFDPANLTSLIGTGTSTAVIKSEKVVDALPMHQERARKNAPHLFGSLLNFGESKNALSLLIDEIYIDGYASTDGLQIRTAKYSNGRFDFRIQQGADKVFTIDTDAPKGAYLLYNGEKYCYIRFNQAMIQSMNVSLSADSSFAFADDVFDRGKHPFAYSVVSNLRKSSKVIYSGDILQPYPFSSQELLNKDGMVFVETTETGGLGRIVYNQTLGEYIYEHRKFASRYNPSLNLKISTKLRENFSGNDVIRISGKVYASKGDSSYPGTTIPVTFAWEKEGKYPAAADVAQFTAYNPVTNETWTDFSISGQIGDIGAWGYNALRAYLSMSTAEQYANSHVDKVIAVAGLKIEIIKAEFYADYNGIELVDNSVFYPMPQVSAQAGKFGEAKIGSLSANVIRSICRMARIYFSKVKTLVSETEILYLNDNFRTPTMGKSALSVEDGILYFYDKDGNKKTINMD